jgi:hypothetical protein
MARMRNGLEHPRAGRSLGYVYAVLQPLYWVILGAAAWESVWAWKKSQ